MRKLIFVLMPLFFILIISLGNAYSDNMLRCQGGIVRLGDTKADLINKCGNPTHTRKSWFNIEYFNYDRGSNRFIKTIKIIDGKVNRIKSDGYGGRYSK